jgi:hypothetical protein
MLEGNDCFGFYRKESKNSFTSPNDFAADEQQNCAMTFVCKGPETTLYQDGVKRNWFKRLVDFMLLKINEKRSTNCKTSSKEEATLINSAPLTNNFYRVLRSPETEDGNRVNHRLRTFVVIEIFEGQQILNNWRCGDLVHYVNNIAKSYERNDKTSASLHNGTKMFK